MRFGEPSASAATIASSTNLHQDRLRSSKFGCLIRTGASRESSSEEEEEEELEVAEEEVAVVAVAFLMRGVYPLKLRVNSFVHEESDR